MSEKMIVLRVDGMSCSHCERAIMKAVGELPGVTDVSVDLGEKTVTVEYDAESTDYDAICNAIEDQGYDVRR